LYVVKDMEAGERLTPENLKAIRPGYGLPPKFLSVLMGRRISKAVKRGTALSWDLLD